MSTQRIGALPCVCCLFLSVYLTTLVPLLRFCVDEDKEEEEEEDDEEEMEGDNEDDDDEEEEEEDFDVFDADAFKVASTLFPFS